LGNFLAGQHLILTCEAAFIFHMKDANGRRRREERMPTPVERFSISSVRKTFYGLALSARFQCYKPRLDAECISRSIDVCGEH